jgi:hypothetical protein
LEAFLIRDELPRVPGIQEGTTSVEDSELEEFPLDVQLDISGG